MTGEIYNLNFLRQFFNRFFNLAEPLSVDGGKRIVEDDERLFALESSVYQRKAQTKRYNRPLPRAEILFVAKFSAALEFYSEILIHFGVLAEFGGNRPHIRLKRFKRRRNVFVFKFFLGFVQIPDDLAEQFVFVDRRRYIFLGSLRRALRVGIVFERGFRDSVYLFWRLYRR